MCHVPNTYAFNMLEELPFCESLGEGISKVVLCRDFGDVNVYSVHNLTNKVILPLNVFSPLWLRGSLEFATAPLLSQ